MASLKDGCKASIYKYAPQYRQTNAAISGEHKNFIVKVISFYRTHYKKSNLNCVIPILKHLEASRIIVDRIKGYSLGEVPESYDTYNNKVLTNLQRIESNGLQTTDGMVYSEYNPYTATGRPSNRFGGMNFAALNKKDGSRKKFISRHGRDGMLVEMDYDACLLYTSDAADE